MCFFKLFFFFSVFSFAISNVLRDAVFPLDLIHYNDFHDRFEETSYQLPVCTSNDTSCVGGFARLAYEIKALLKMKPNALLLNAGDAFQGTYWYSTLKWNVTQHFLNMLPHDAHTIGNHEFDDGVTGLAPYLAALRAPVVLANIDSTHESLLDGLYTPHIVVERNGRKIGIIGVSTTETKRSSNPDNIIFLDPVKVVKEEARNLVAKGVDIIIVLSHCGLHVDRQIAKTAGENVDIIVGGHSHSLLWNGPSPSNETVHGAYPLLVESESKAGHKIVILQASAHTKYLGNITVYFDSHGEITSYDAAPIFLNRSIPEDPEIKALLQPYKDSLHKLVDEVVGYSKDDLSNNICKQGECSLGNLMVDAFLDATKEAYPSNSTQVGLVLAQVLKSPLPKGDVTRGTLLNVSPFTNKVVTVLVAGRHILQALERTTTARIEENPILLPFLPSVAGMKVTLNLTSGKAESILVKHESGDLPLSLEEEYQLTIMNFVYNGGNGFDMFKNNGRELKVVGKDVDLIEKYIRKVSPLSDILDNRLVIVT